MDEQFEAVPENLEDDGEDVDERLLEEDLELHIGEAGRNWKRPAPPPLNPASKSLGALEFADPKPHSAMWNLPAVALTAV